MTVMYGGGYYGRSGLVRLGALASSDAAAAHVLSDQLSQARLDLQRALVEAQNEGVALPADLVAGAGGLDQVWDALDTRIDTMVPADLPAWRAQAQDLQQQIAALQAQLDRARGSSSSGAIVTLVVGGIAAALVAGGVAWLVRSNAKRGAA